MRRRSFALLSVFALAVGIMTPTTAAAAGSTSRFEKINVSHIDPQILPFLVDKNRQLDLMVQLSDQPVVARVGDATDAGTAVTQAQRDTWRSQIKANQTSVVAAIRSHGGQVPARCRTPTTVFTSTSPRVRWPRWPLCRRRRRPSRAHL